MLARVGVPACLLLFTVLCTYGVPRVTTQVATAIRTRVAAGLQASSIAGVTVATDGREVTLIGNVSSREGRARAAEMARAVPGTRSIRNNVMIVEGLSPAPSSASSPTLPSSGTSAVPRREAVQSKVSALLVEHAIEFDARRRATIATPSLAVLGEVARVLQEAPAVRARVEGHTDNFGQAEFNHALSLSRAQAVVDYLVAQGVPAQRLQAAGFGQDRPIAPNETRAGRMKNRRVEIVVD